LKYYLLSLLIRNGYGGSSAFYPFLLHALETQLIRSAIKNAINLGIGLACIPATIGAGLGGDVDWLGAFLGVTGLILFNFSFK
jgi:hypothetical protein